METKQSITRRSWIDGIRQRHHLDDRADIRVKQVAADTEAEADPFVFTAKITSDSVDRDNEVLLPQGMDPSDFDVTGSVFWNHDIDRPVAIPGALKRSQDSWLAKATFLKRPEDFTGEFFPDFVRAFVTQAKALGKRVGISVGFIPLEQRNASDRDKEVFGESVRKVISKWKLLEWSVAPLQSNADAFVTAVGKGLIPKEAAPEFGVTQAIEDVAVTGKKKVCIVWWDDRQPDKPKLMDVNKRIQKMIDQEIARQSGQIYLT